jgi:hypothetical protein
MATRQDVEASARGMKPIVGTRREGAPFAHRGFSERSIRNMVTGGIDAPEQLLFMTETQLKKKSRRLDTRNSSLQGAIHY